MSTTVDNKVVEMKFDNRQFETNVKKSMSSLDKLKEKLKLTEAAKGLKDVDEASNKINFDKLNKAAEVVTKRFSTMGIVGMKVISNITDSVMNLTKKTVAFAKNGILSGGKNRAFNLENARFQLKGLLEDEKKVQDVMENVSAAVDGTAYGLDAAAKVASQLAASGMQAGKDMESSLKAVAGVAAMTNSSYEDIGDIFTKVAGNGRLMASELQRLSSRGMNAAAVLGKELGKTEAEIREMVHKGQIDFKTFSDAMNSAFGEHAKKANETFQGALSNVKSALGRIGADFISPLIKKNGPIVVLFNTIREKINQVRTFLAPVAKTFKKTVTSFSNIANRYIQKLDLSKLLRPFEWFNSKWDEFAGRLKSAGVDVTKFNKSYKKASKDQIDSRIKLIQADKTLSKEEKDRQIRAAKNSKNYRDTEILTKTITKYRDELKKNKTELENMQKSGKKLTKEQQAQLETYKKNIQDLKVLRKNTEMGNYAFAHGVKTIKNLRHEGFKYSETQEVVSKILKSQQKDYHKLSDAQLTEMGYSKRQIKILRQMTKQSDKSGYSIKQLAGVMDKPSGRWLFIDSIKNIAKTLKRIVKPIAKAWSEIFPKPNATKTGFYGLIKGFHDLTEKLKPSKETCEKLQRTFKGLFALFDIGKQIIVGVVKTAFGVFGKASKETNFSILDLTAGIGDLIVKFRDWLNDGNKITTFFVGVSNGISFVVNCIKKLIGLWPTVKQFFIDSYTNVKEFFLGFSNPFENLSFDGLIEAIKHPIEFIKSLFGSISGWFNSENIGVNITDGLAGGILSGVSRLKDSVLSIGKTIVDTIKDFLGIHSPSKVFMFLGAMIIGGLLAGLMGGENDVTDETLELSDIVVKTPFDYIRKNIPKIKKAFSVIKEAIMKISPVIIDTIESVKEGISVALSGIGDAMEDNLGVVATIVSAISIIFVFKALGKLIDKIRKIINPFDGIISSVQNVINSASGVLDAYKEKIQSKGKAVKMQAMATLIKSLILVAGAVIVLGMQPIDQLWQGVKVLGAITAIIAAFIVVTSLVTKSKNTSGEVKKKTKGINLSILGVVGIVASLKLMIDAFMPLLKELKGANFTDVLTPLGTLTILAGEIIGLLFVLTKLKIDKSALYSSAALVALAFSISIVVKSFLSLASLNVEQAVKGVVSISVLFIGIGALVALMSLTSGKEFLKAGLSITLMAVGISILTKAIKKIARIDQDSITKGLAVINGFFLSFIGIMVVSKLSGQHTDAVGKGILFMSAAILVLSIAMKRIGKMDSRNISRSMQVITGFILSFIGIIFFSSLSGEYTDKAGKGILAMAGAVLILSFAMSTLAKIEPGKLKGAIKSVALLALIASGLMVATKLISDKNLRGNIIAIGILIGALTLALGALSFIKTNKILGAAASISVFVAAVSLLGFYVSKIKGKAIPALIIMGLIVTLLAGLMFQMAKIKPGPAIKTAGSIAIVLAAMAGVLTILSKVGRRAKTTAKAAGVLALIGGVVAGLAFIFVAMHKFNANDSIKSAVSLSIMLMAMVTVMDILQTFNGRRFKTIRTCIKLLALLAPVVAEIAIIFGLMSALNVEASITSAIALSIMLFTMSKVLDELSNLGRRFKTTEGNIKQLALLGLVVAELAVIFGTMSALNVEASITSAIALSIMLTTMTGTLFVLSKFVKYSKDIFPVIGALGLLGLVVAELGVILGAMSALNLEASLNNVLALSIMLTVMTGVLAVISILGTTAGTAFAGVGALAVMGLVVGELAIIFGLMDHFNVEASLETVKSISTILLTMAGVLVVCALVGTLSVAAFIGILALAVLIAAMGALFVGIGALVENNPQIEEYAEKAISVLGKIGEGIGSFFGGIAAGFTDKMSETLPKLGQCLSAFATNLVPFITIISTIPATLLTAVLQIAGAILVITSAELINGIISFASGSDPFDKLQDQLIKLGRALLSFATVTKGIDYVHVVKAAIAAKSVAIAVADIPNSGGILQDIIGGKDIAGFGSGISSLGSGLWDFYNQIKQIPAEGFETIKSGAAAAKDLAVAASAIPNSGGLWGMIVGNNDIQDFAPQLEKLAKGVVAFHNIIKDGNIDPATIETGASAAKDLADAANTIPNSGGLWGMIVGNNDIQDFAPQLEKLAKGVVAFHNIIKEGNIDPDTLEKGANAASTLAGIASEIPNSGGLWGMIVGNNDIGDFGGQLEQFAKGVASFGNTIAGTDLSNVENGVAAANSLASMASALSGSDDRDFWDRFTGKQTGMEQFSENLPNFGAGLANFADEIKDIDKTSLAEGIDSLSGLIDIIQAISNMGSYQSDVFSKWLQGLSASAINDFTATLANFNSTRVTQAISDYIIDPVISTINTSYTQFSSAAGWCVDGMINGFNLKDDELKTAVQTYITDVIKNTIHSEMDENSPSKVTEKDGKYVVLGFLKGLKSGKNNIKKTVKQDITDSTKKAIRDGLKIHSPSLDMFNLGSLAGEGFANGCQSWMGKIKGVWKDISEKGVINTVSDVFKSKGNGFSIDSLLGNKFNMDKFDEALNIGLGSKGSKKTKLSDMFDTKGMKNLTKNFQNGLSTNSSKISGNILDDGDKISKASKKSGKKIKETQKITYKELLKMTKTATKSASSWTYGSAIKNMKKTLGYDEGVIQEFSDRYLKKYKTYMGNIQKGSKLFKETEKLFKESAMSLYKKSSYYKEDKKEEKKLKDDLKKLTDKRKKIMQSMSDAEEPTAKKNAAKKKKIDEHNKKVEEGSNKKLKKKTFEPVTVNTKKFKRQLKEIDNEIYQLYIKKKSLDDKTAAHAAKAFNDMAKNIKKTIQDTYKITSLEKDNKISLFEEFEDPEKTQEKIEELEYKKASLEEEMAENTKKNTIESKEANKKLREELEKVNSELEENINKNEEYSKVTKESVLNNMRSQIEGVSKLYDSYEELEERGIKGALLEELKAMGTDGMKYINAFLSMSDEELSQAKDMYKQTQGLSGTAMKDDLEKKKAQAKRWMKGIQYLAENGFSQKMINQLIEAGPDSVDYVDALRSMSKDELKDFTKTYKEYYKGADNIADGIMAGYVRAGAGKGYTKALKELAKNGTDDNKDLTDSCTAIGNTIGDVLEWAAENGGKKAVKKYKEILSKGEGEGISKNITDGLSKGFIKEGKNVNKNAENMAGDILDTVKKKLDINSPSKKFETIGKNSLEGLNNGLKDTESRADIKSTIKTIVAEIENPFKSRTVKNNNGENEEIKGLVERASDIGKNFISKLKASLGLSEQDKTDFDKKGRAISDCIIEGLRLGLTPTKGKGKDKDGNTKVDEVVEKSGELAKLIIDAFKKELDSHSPSKKFFEIGTFIDQGLINGMASGERAINKNAISIMSGVIETVNDIVENDSDYEPTITPVLDLSEIQNGASSINGIIAGNRSVSLAYAAKAANDINRNRFNNDTLLLNAINKLQDSLSSDNARPNITQHNEFNINGANDPRQTADEVSRILQKEIERRNAVWA